MDMNLVYTGFWLAIGFVGGLIGLYMALAFAGLVFGVIFDMFNE